MFNKMTEEISQATANLLTEKYNEFKEIMIKASERPEINKQDKELTKQFFAFMDDLLHTINNIKDHHMMPFQVILMQIMTLFMSTETDIVLLTEVLSGFQAQLYKIENIPQIKPNKPLDPDEPINGKGLDILRELEEMENKTKH